MVRPQQAEGSTFLQNRSSWKITASQEDTVGWEGYHGLSNTVFPALCLMFQGCSLNGRSQGSPTAAGTAVDMKESWERLDKNLETVHGGRGCHRGKRGLFHLGGSESLYRIGKPLCSFN